MISKSKRDLKYLFGERYKNQRNNFLKELGPDGALEYYQSENVRTNLLYVFWYECKYEKEVFLNHGLIIKDIHPIVRNKNLTKDLLRYFESKIRNISGDFSIIHMDLEKMFPQISKFDFNDLFEWGFLEYVIDLSELDYVSHYVRTIWLKDKPKQKTYETWNHLNYIEYVKGIPVISSLGIHSMLGSHFDLSLHGVWRECENDLRNSLQLPLIGEGWVKERELLNRMQNLFPKLEIIGQGSPKFLFRRHPLKPR